MHVRISPTQQKIKCIVSLGKIKYKTNVKRPRTHPATIIGAMHPKSPFVQQANKVRTVNKTAAYTDAKNTE